METDYVAKLEQQVANLTRLLEITTVLNSVLLRKDVGIETQLRYLMEAAAQLTNCEGASVLLWNEDEQELFFAATSNASKTSQELVGKSVPLDSIAGTIFKQRKLIQVDDIAHDPRHYTQVDETIQFVTRSLLGVPMVSNNKVIGVLEVVNKRRLPWTEDDHQNLQMLASEAAVAIEVGQLLVALQKANTELEEVDKLKSDFIAIASHELRTPLGIILGYVSFLQDAEDDDVRAQANKAMEGALQLRRIIESMVNLRYVKQKESELVKQELTLENVLDDLKRDMLSIANASTHDIEFICHDPDVVVLVDRSRLAMALTNLLTNAISFTPNNGVIRVEAKLHTEQEARFSVTDNGIGIEDDKLEKIFEEFFQVEDHMIRRVGGLGLGLSICRALIQAHGGRIWAESDGLNQGAKFTIALPIN